MKINQKEMHRFINDFNVLRHKFLYAVPNAVIDPHIGENLLKNFSPKVQGYWDMDQAVETFLTMEKVYHYGDDRSAENNNILEQVIEKFLRQYVNIEGMEELFQSSYFYFEWMMHLEYKEQQHDYSYYRDHYMHQVRNLYEMFMLLDEKGLWRICMEIYESNNNRVADEIKSSVLEEQRWNSKDFEELAKVYEEWKFNECCYHYIIFATAIVSSLVHDIGYPIVFMKRNMSRVHGFLPISHIFMDMKNSIPDIKSLLSQSLLFSSVGGDEIQKKLEKDDHGAYSAVILLYQYYDNGKIFSLDPVKRMVIELSALVIYNHTMKYAFQDRKNYDHYHNVFVENPISYLFRLCDDLQEWERVYFLISDRSTFFICGTCMTPMIRHVNKRHVVGACEEQKFFRYACVCGKEGWNSLWFPYRRMINVSPFTDLIIDNNEKGWTIVFRCDKKALLQLAHYNDTFAIQRLQGINEIREMVKRQKKLPDIFVKAFVSNNPVAIKVKILEEFIGNERIDQYLNEVMKVAQEKTFEYCCDEKGQGSFSNDLKAGLEKLQQYVQDHRTYLYDDFARRIKNKYSESRVDYMPGGQSFGDVTTSRLMEESIGFYLYILLLGLVTCKKDLNFCENLKTSQEEQFTVYRDALASYCDKLAQATAALWNIRDASMIDLIADCLVMMHCDIWDEKLLCDKDSFRYQVEYPIRQDICDIVQGYMDEGDYLYICKKGNRIGPFNENIFDFYSDYFLYFIMDDCVERKD